MRSWRPLRLRDRCRVVLASSSTMRKFENFTTTQIFHEINFCKQKVPEMAIWTISEAVISSFWEILAIFIGWNFLNSKFTAYEIIKKAIFGTFRLPKLISRKNLSGSKILKFPHCEFRKEGKRGPLGKISFPMFCHIVQLLLRWLMIPTLKRIIMSDRKWFLVCVWHSTHHRSFFCSYL